MATMNISLPDELKARMDDDRRQMSWSAIARNAFELELKSTRETGGDMSAVIERLRASKQKMEEEQRPEWVERGRQWVMDYAEYEEARQVAELAAEVRKMRGLPDAYNLMGLLYTAIYEDEPARSDVAELAEQLFRSERIPSSVQLCWFLGGVEEVWDEIANKI